jgi:hypothetical protein
VPIAARALQTLNTFTSGFANGAVVRDCSSGIPIACCD